MHMAGIWPFGKKPAEPRQVKQPEKRRIVEYERKKDESASLRSRPVHETLRLARSGDLFLSLIHI